MCEASTMYGFNPRHGFWEKHRDIASILLGPRLIMQQFVIGQSWQAIGYVPKARDHVAHRWHSSKRPSGNRHQRQSRSDYQQDGAATHGPHAPLVCEG
jgi:hypothetical protein